MTQNTQNDNFFDYNDTSIALSRALRSVRSFNLISENVRYYTEELEQSLCSFELYTERELDALSFDEKLVDIYRKANNMYICVKFYSDSFHDSDVRSVLDLTSIELKRYVSHVERVIREKNAQEQEKAQSELSTEEALLSEETAFLIEDVLCSVQLMHDNVTLDYSDKRSVSAMRARLTRAEKKNRARKNDIDTIRTRINALVKRDHEKIHEIVAQFEQ